ncbi:protein kinase domain-containing protein [Leptothermofonsia sp. ETS-13]|uniref:protein kinase domain-containing protein n=1 Tax=Leptothermofonsia sp. ETS-13 TaxID=3035696 RepID=UPI003BA0741B
MVILTLLHPRQRTPLKQWQFENESLIRIGRAPENDVILEDLLVSRSHLELRRVDLPVSSVQTQTGWHLVNHSANGTFVNGYLMSQGIISEDALIQLARGGPLLQLQILETSNSFLLGKSSQLPVVPETTASIPGQKIPVCTHEGNTPENLFCIHCGQPVKVQQTIRQYQVLRVLGRGGMGTTYLVWNPSVTSPSGHLQGGVQVLKEMNADMARIPKAQELFEREANTLKALNHPGIPRFYDFFIEDGKKYLVMELLHGKDMEKWVRHRGPVGEEQAVTWMIQTCEVLEYLHDREVPIIHRDIKPGNLLVQTVSNRVVVLDFGAVKAVGMPSRTRIGAEGYSAPEQTLGRPMTQSDLYAVGASLIYLLTADSPIRYYKKRNQGYGFALERIPAMSPALRTVVERVTQYRPSDRYQTARELANALNSCL